ncbi:MAG: hypothetical protein H6934_11335 [Burkholderiaceae bacterium]|nr:hypothetical protein [Burkholderiaceae bacterium]
MRKILVFAISAALTSSLLSGAARLPGGEAVRGWLIGAASSIAPMIEHAQSGITEMLSGNPPRAQAPRRRLQSVRLVVGLAGAPHESADSELLAGERLADRMPDPGAETTPTLDLERRGIRIRIVAKRSVDASDASLGHRHHIDERGLEGLDGSIGEPDVLAFASMLAQSVSTHRQLARRNWFDQIFSADRELGETGWTAGAVASSLGTEGIGLPSRRPAVLAAAAVLALLLISVVARQRA